MSDTRPPRPITTSSSFDPPRLDAAAPDPELLIKVGEAFATSSAVLLRDLASLEAGCSPHDPAVKAGRARVERLEALGVLIQEIGRITAGRAPMPLERIDLAAAVRAAVAEHAARQDNAGRRIVARDGGWLPVRVNAATLAQLIDLAIEHACTLGDRIQVEAKWCAGTDRHPAVSIEVVRRPARGAADPGGGLPWLLVEYLSGALGWTAGWRRDGATVTLMLHLPSERPEAEPVAAVETAPRTRPAVGREALLIEPNEWHRIEALRLLENSGLVVHPAASIAQARLIVDAHAPDVVVTGVPTDEPACRALLAHARAARPRMRVLELVDDDDAFDFSGPGVGHPARVGRQALARTLLPALTQEIDAAWSG